MSETEISAAEIEHCKSHVGRTVEHTDIVDQHVALRFAATLNLEHPTKRLPPLWHYGLFLTSVGTASLDTDGHPRRGDFLPPVRLPRRMFAGSALKFLRPLVIGQEVLRLSRIAAVEHRLGKTGDLIFVRVAMTLSQAGTVCVQEEQTIVYRAAGARTPAVKSTPRTPLSPDETAEAWLPTSMELFRYSAATFNSHRIHYDKPYVMDDEGYPDLVVHGPLIATRLCHFAARLIGRDLSNFNFRGEAPAFVN